eukprot:gene9696-15903_t
MNNVAGRYVRVQYTDVFTFVGRSFETARPESKGVVNWLDLSLQFVRTAPQGYARLRKMAKAKANNAYINIPMNVSDGVVVPQHIIDTYKRFVMTTFANNAYAWNMALAQEARAFYGLVQGQHEIWFMGPGTA